jgi:hypothetical protein
MAFIAKLVLDLCAGGRQRHVVDPNRSVQLVIEFPTRHTAQHDFHGLCVRAAYNIGFANALDAWAKAIRQNGLAVVSELCWLRDKIPDVAMEFFRSGYPEMQSVEQNIATAEKAGYKIFNIYALPKEAWVKDYYDILEPRAKSLVRHSDIAVRDFAVEALREIGTFKKAQDSYGYVFFVLQRSD